MTRKGIIIFSLFLIANQLFSQLSGTYTIGSTGNYTSFGAAVSALHSQGVSGNVVFNVSPGTYTENITINSFTGNTQYQVTFQSAGLDSSSVVLQHPSGSSVTNNHLIKFNQARNISFKHMTLQRSGSNSYSIVIDISNNSSYLTFSNLVITNSSTSIADDFASLIIASNNSGTSNSNNLTLSNSRLVNGSYGVFLQGLSSGTLAANLNIQATIFQNQYRTAIYAAYQSGPKVLNNIINSSSSYSLYKAVDFLYCNLGPKINFNKIDFNKGYGIFLTNSQGMSVTGEIFNNFISTNGSLANALYFSNAGTFNLYFNSINLYGASQLGISISGSTSQHLRFANNILYSAGANDLISVATSATTPFDYCNYNNYKTAGDIGDWKSVTNIATLAAWKTASGYDANSISENPNFVSNSDLHIQGQAVVRKGTSMLNAPMPSTDIDGIYRHNLNPDLGAHEFGYDDLAITRLAVNESMCVGSQNEVKITLKNNCNYNLSVTNLQLKYKFNNATVSELYSINNLAANDSIEYTFSAKIQAPAQSAYQISSWVIFNQDKNSSNDTVDKTVNTYNYPNLQLPLDTNVCHNNPVTLDAGSGFDKYQWSTGDTTQDVVLTANQLGLGGTFVSVRVWKAGCLSKDSTLVFFKDCTGFDENSLYNKITIFPVPTSDVLSISFENNIEIVEIEIFNQLGQLEKKLYGNVKSIPVSFLSNGFYYVVFKTNEGFIRKSFIKN